MTPNYEVRVTTHTYSPLSLELCCIVLSGSRVTLLTRHSDGPTAVLLPMRAPGSWVKMGAKPATFQEISQELNARLSPPSPPSSPVKEKHRTP